MVRKVIIPERSKFILNLPEAYIGQYVEIIAFPVNEPIKKQRVKKASKSEKSFRKNLSEFYKNSNVDLKDFKFNRDELYDRV